MPASDAAHIPIRLRPMRQSDLPVLFEYQLDPESNRMSVTNPRSAESFADAMGKALADPRVVPRVIVRAAEAESDPPETILGSISIFQMDGLDAVGYLVARPYWGRGIASRALDLLLAEVTRRPLHAKAALTNAASIRVLRKAGFRITGTFFAAASERYPAADVVSFILD